MEEFSLMEIYKIIKEEYSAPTADNPVIERCSDATQPLGVMRAGRYYLSRMDKPFFFVLDSDLSERIFKNIGIGKKALLDEMTMSEERKIQIPRPYLGHLGLKKDIARITHNGNGKAIIVVYNEPGAEYAQGLLKSLLEK